MKKFFTARRCVQAALVLAAFASAGPAFAQSTGTWSAGISSRNGRPFVQAQTTNHSGYGSFAQISSGYGSFAEISSPNRFDLAPSSLGPTDRFGAGTQR
jgi:hypothetical protein